MKRIHWLLLLAFVGLVMSFCKKETLLKSTDNSKALYFPNGVGSYWKYHRYDSITGTSDTIIVTIQSTVLKNGKTYSVWTYKKSPVVYDSAYVYCTKDSVVFMGTNFQFVENIILIPCTIHSKWNPSGMLGDTTFVIGQEKIGLLETFKLNHRIFGIDVSMNDDMWLAPNIGIIKEDIKEFNILKPKNESWQLIDYSAK
jgi:hypothetical protein